MEKARRCRNIPFCRDILLQKRVQIFRMQMKPDEHPKCYVIAGPNGAGKTTFALKYLPSIASCRNFINADEIAKGVSPLDFGAGLVQAGRIFMDILSRKIAERQDFAFETTLAGRGYLPKIAEWRKSGWRVILIYLYIPNAKFSAMRVQQRVLHGGHSIPLAEIRRRFLRSLRNLFEYSEICDYSQCLDNTGSQAVPIFEKRFRQPMEVLDCQLYQKLQESLQK